MKKAFWGLLLCLFLTGEALALESDQYYIWRHKDLKDSTEGVNRILNEELQDFLTNRINDKKYRGKIPCAKIPYRFFRYIRPHFFLDRVKRLMLKDQGVFFFPEKKNLVRDYNDSIFQGFIWPFLMPVSQTVRINDVFLGTDKIDHFFSSGRKYYVVYQRAINRGEDHHTALKRAIDYGLMGIQEKGILGYWSSNAFSFADMESNYQGMMMCLDFCQGENPILKYDEQKGWQVNRPINWRDYINPLWDEAYNNSYFLKTRFKGVKKVLLRDYCEQGRDPANQKIWRAYTRRLKSSFHTDYLRGLMSLGKVPDPRPQSLHQVCDYPEGVMKGPAVWDFIPSE